MHFTLPIDSGKTFDVYGTITHDIPFHSVRFFHGSVPAVEGISSTEGTFSAAVYQNKVSAVVQYSGHVQFELTYTSFSMDPYTTNSPPLVLQQVNVTEKYVSKESEDSVIPSGTKHLRSRHLQPRSTPSVVLQSSGTARLKVLVLYTKQAVDYCGDENCLLLHITLAIGNFNVALQNSLVNMTVDYVAERIQEYDTFVEDSDMGVMLSRMGSTISTDRRNVLGCHAVHLTTANTMYCGISSYAFNGLTDGYSASFFGCIGGYMTLAHEVGHNLGLHHDPSGYGGNTPNRAYCWDDSTGLGNCHRSILSYGGCVTPQGKTNCDRVKYFSTPDVREMGNVVGGAMFNNAQQLRNNIFPFMEQFTPFFVNPSEVPTQSTMVPSQSTMVPSGVPVGLPRLPSRIPTQVPTRVPMGVPSEVPRLPTGGPTEVPSEVPILPTGSPSKVPTWVPTGGPTRIPTGGPTRIPTGGPTWIPTGGPTWIPTWIPTGGPTWIPTRIPTRIPTGGPTGVPIGVPTRVPTGAPTMIITIVAPSFFLYIVISSSVFFCFLLLCFCYCQHRLAKIKKSQAFQTNSDGDVSNPWYNQYDFVDIYKKMSSKKNGSYQDIQQSIVPPIPEIRPLSKTNSMFLLKQLNASRFHGPSKEPLPFLPEKRMSIESSMKSLSNRSRFFLEEDDDRDTVTFGISSKSVVKKI